MPLTTLRTLFVHCDWARDKLLAAAAPLSDEQLERPFDMGPGSLRATLAHMAQAERVWLDRWQEKRPGRPAGGSPGIAELGQRFQQIATEREALLDRLLPAGESKRITFTDREGNPRTLPLGDMMLHVCNHGAHHRAQASNMLRHLGVKCPWLDYLAWKRDKGVRHPETSYDLETIREYFRYGDWALEQVIEPAATLSDAALDRPFEMGMGTLRKTLLHIGDAEAWWYENWTGKPPDGFQQYPDGASVAQFRARFTETARRRDAYLASPGDDDMHRTVTARPPRGGEMTFALGDTLLQLCLHGTHHRAQAINMLRHLGATPPALDYVRWIAITAGAPAPQPSPARSR